VGSSPNSHLKTHDISQFDYKHKFGPITSEVSHIQFSQNIAAAAEKITTLTVGQQQVYDFVQSLGNFEVQSNVRSVIYPFELDIYLPQQKLAIEYNGLYFHSDKIVDKNYHLVKTRKCESVGIQLIHIFEDEWNNNKEIMKSILRSKLNAISTKIFARNCQIVIPTKQQKKQFLNENHRQQNDKSIFWFGLTHNNKLVSIMTFSKLRKALGSSHVDGSYELSRFCSLTNSIVVGSFSKLLAHFKRTVSFKQLITYADLRFSSHQFSVYSSNGFKLKKQSRPNYFYCTKNKRLHRYNFTKQILVNKFNGDPTKTEFEIADELQLVRVWDCGQLCYELSG